SRSSGVICSQRSIIRLRQYQCRRGPPRKPPKRILLRISSPKACQKVMTCQPKSAGMSQFHKLMSTKPNSARNSTANSVNFSPFSNRFLLISVLISPKLRIDGAKSLAQMQDGVMLAREQGIDAYAGLPRNLLEAVTHKFSPNEHIPLFRWQFVKRTVKFVKQHAARVSSLGSSIR